MTCIQKQRGLKKHRKIKGKYLCICGGQMVKNNNKFYCLNDDLLQEKLSIKVKGKCPIKYNYKKVKYLGNRNKI